MSGCRCNCSYLSVIAGILSGVAIAVLYAIGLISANTVFAITLLIGLSGIFFAPVYASLDSLRSGGFCFCAYRTLLIITAILTAVASVTGLVVVQNGSLAAVAITVAFAVLFAVTLLSTLICLARCAGCDDD